VCVFVCVVVAVTYTHFRLCAVSLVCKALSVRVCTYVCVCVRVRGCEIVLSHTLTHTPEIVIFFGDDVIACVRVVQLRGSLASMCVCALSVCVCACVRACTLTL